MTHLSPILCFFFTFQVVSKFFLLPDLTPFFDFPDRRAAFVTGEKLSLVKIMHLCRRLELQLHTFFTSILDGWRYVVTSIPHPLYPRDRSCPSWPLHGRRGGLQNLCALKKRKSYCCCRESIQNFFITQLIPNLPSDYFTSA